MSETQQIQIPEDKIKISKEIGSFTCKDCKLDMRGEAETKIHKELGHKVRKQPPLKLKIPKEMEDLPEFKGYVQFLEGEYTKVLDGELRTFNKILVVSPSEYGKAYHFGQKKEFYWDDYAIEQTQAVAGYIYIGGERFDGEWLPLFILWYSSWWIDWVKRAFDIKNVDGFQNKLIKLKSALTEDLPAIVFSSYYMQVALKKSEDAKYAEKHLQQFIENIRADKRTSATIAAVMIAEYEETMEVPSQEKEETPWKTIIVMIAAGVGVFVTWTKWFGWW